jgi:hypothetical protein
MRPLVINNENAKPNISRSADTKKGSMHIRVKRLDLVRRLKKLAGGNSLKNKYRLRQRISAEITWRRAVACPANRPVGVTVCF